MEKRIGNWLGLLVCLLVFPLVVFADVGMPEIHEYGVVVNSVEGVVFETFNEKIVIPYDTKLTIYSEYYDTDSNKLLGYTKYNGKYGDIDLSKVKMVKEEINLSDFDKLGTPERLYVFADDAYLYNGPSLLYGKVDGEVKIPKGEIVSYEYCDGGSWAYVVYNGTGGWIFIYSVLDVYDNVKSSVANITKSLKSVLVYRDITSLKVNPNEDEIVKVNIPEGTELNYEYYYEKVKSAYVYITYEGVSGWMYASEYYKSDDVDGLVSSDCNVALFYEDVDIYMKKGDDFKKTNEKLMAGTEAVVNYSWRDDELIYLYVSYDGEKVWVLAESETDYAINYGFEEYFMTLEDVDVYEKPSLNSKKINSISMGKRVARYYSVYYYDFGESWQYVRDGDIEGWVLSSGLEDLGEYSPICTVANGNEEKPKNEIQEANPIKKSLSLVMIAMLAVGGAIVLALVVVVTIILINKKKSKVVN